MPPAALGTTKYVEEFFYYQGLVYAARGDTSTAIARFNDVLRFNKNFFPAQESKAQVEAEPSRPHDQRTVISPLTTNGNFHERNQLCPYPSQRTQQHGS